MYLESQQTKEDAGCGQQKHPALWQVPGKSPDVLDSAHLEKVFMVRVSSPRNT
jgi:hypothetical protein